MYKFLNLWFLVYYISYHDTNAVYISPALNNNLLFFIQILSRKRRERSCKYSRFLYKILKNFFNFVTTNKNINK